MNLPDRYEDAPPPHQLTVRELVELLLKEDMAQVRARVAKKIEEKSAREWAEGTVDLHACYLQGWKACGEVKNPHGLSRLRLNPYTPGKTGKGHDGKREYFWNWGWSDREFDRPNRVDVDQ